MWSWKKRCATQFRLLDLDPDMVIIYHSVNDIKSRMVWPPEIYNGDNSACRVSSNEPTHSLSDYLFEKSNILRIVSVRWGNKPSNWWLDTADKHPESYQDRKFRSQIQKTTYPSGIFESIPAAKMLEVNKPIYFRRNIEGIIRLARSKNIKIVLATFAHASEPDEKFGSFLTSLEYEKAFAEHNDLLKEIAEAEGVAILDYANIFPDEKKYYVDGVHVNEEGSSIKARIFADFVRPLIGDSVITDTIQVGPDA